MAEFSEKPVKPRNGGGWLAAGVFILLSMLATYYMRVATNLAGIGEKMEYINQIKSFPDNGVPLRTTYTGIGPLDTFFSFLVSAFLPGAAGWDRGFYVLQSYFLVSFFPIVTIISIESCRKRNHFALTSFTSIWALFYQTVGGAVIVPLYYLAYLRDSRGSQYWSAESRRVPLAYAKALLPALIIGYLVPTILMFLPYSEENYWTTQGTVALWQPSPWFVNAILWACSSFYARSGTEAEESVSTLADVKYLGSIYSVAFIASAIAHVVTMSVCLFSGDWQHSFGHVFVPDNITHDTPLSDALRMIFQVDFWIISAASLVWAYVAVWDLKRIGKTNVSLIQTAAAILLGSIVVGPAAAVTGVWYWREHIMAKKMSP
ncbi:hypothetical protein LTR67_005564 [Exophiala xenobiotica]